jgi:hypothetical protein
METGTQRALDSKRRSIYQIITDLHIELLQVALMSKMYR